MTFRLVSSLVINEHRNLDDWYREFNDRAWGPARVFAAIEHQHGCDTARAFYTAFGRRFHVDRNEDLDTVLPAALADADLSVDLAAAADDAGWDTVLRSSIIDALDPVGVEVGTPILHLDGTAVFGPVLTTCPRGDDAVGLFDSLRSMLATPGFSEVQRARAETLDRSDPALDQHRSTREARRV